MGRNGLIYIGAKDHTFYAVDSAKGKLAWKYRTHGAISSSAAIDDNSVVYFGSEDNFIYALDGATGGGWNGNLRPGAKSGHPLR